MAAANVVFVTFAISYVIKPFTRRNVLRLEGMSTVTIIVTLLLNYIFRIQERDFELRESQKTLFYWIVAGLNFMYPVVWVKTYVTAMNKGKKAKLKLEGLGINDKKAKDKGLPTSKKDMLISEDVSGVNQKAIYQAISCIYLMRVQYCSFLCSDGHRRK
eukprot:TRINITY_DN983_c0_g3_i10.p3 TRINITY_DN983_c0_g3~~TRINITY_DN983_c0_g3_i10.p3  ORF type:complete len:159 (+),score=34.10 TRINITY_DN983_c0_g3_i10:216-692(+)